MLAFVVDSLLSILSMASENNVAEARNLFNGNTAIMTNDLTFQDKWEGEGVGKPRGHLGTLHATV